ncbi:ABC-type transporter, ATPase subunit [Corynebacterium glyciniphilum AJ 3170]|uniref:ABC-type transporter, ATPase subunit n=1 Tax=Corynebacterium glyciniphilum AJ 3170 TaxID=1404245 RepID=X5DUC0_9CORY|nr:ABC transporter ATP-binding protein [Corynebacterium glyciniphilum]AHW64874.1 ABC-type transporter, ATPase subunit [Corynebacterium glyciniphilum AJ 3170]
MSGPERLPVATGRRSTAAVWQALSGRRALLIFAAAISAGAAALELVTPALLGTIVDDISDGGENRPIWLYGGLIAAAVIAASALSVLGVLLASRVLERLLATLRERLVTTALRMPQERVERSGTGDLVSRASDDVAQVSEALSQVLPSLSRTVFTIILTLGGLFLLDWRFGLTFLAAVPLYWFALRWYVRLAPPLYAAERAAFGTRAHHLLSALKGLDTVLAYRLSGWHSVRIALSSWAVATWALRARTVQTMFAWRIDLAFVAVLSTVLFVGYGLVGADLVTVGAATTAVLYFLRLQGPLRGLMIEIDTLQAAAASLARIIGVTDLGSTRDAAEATDAAESADGQPGGHVRVNSVRFAYQGGTDVLHDVSLTIPAGQRVAVVGTSGAGKTTLAALIAGIHRPSTGTVDAPVDTMLVSQETHIFSGTLRDNLTLAAPDVDDKDLVTALTRVGAADLLEELTLGLDSPIGVQGHPLTAAQEQHLALTRLLIADPDLAILDEATAEAGSAHAAVLDRAAEVVLQGRTGVVIAHRLSQAAACDRIVLMEQGRVLEDGSHDALVAAGGPYSRLWAAWNANRTPHT